MATRNGEQHEVVVVGGGPAGLALATRLKAHGIKDVVVLEREQEAGGVPRDCGHWGFGWESHRRLMSGPQYAARLRDEAEQVDVRTGHTVLSFSAPGMMRVHSPATGIVQIAAKRIVLATGTREIHPGCPVDRRQQAAPGDEHPHAATACVFQADEALCAARDHRR